jgi:hypothetical protein
MHHGSSIKAWPLWFKVSFHLAGVQGKRIEGSCWQYAGSQFKNDADKRALMRMKESPNLFKPNFVNGPVSDHSLLFQRERHLARIA